MLGHHHPQITSIYAKVDLDALRANARFMLEQAAGKPIRVASKSVRSAAVLRRILELDPGFRGILAFTLPEALWLSGEGFENIVVAYPTADHEALRRWRPDVGDPLDVGGAQREKVEHLLGVQPGIAVLAQP